MSAWLGVGLGNPGARYAANRHNVGAFVVGELVRRYAGGSGSPPSSPVPVTTTLDGLKAHKARAHVASLRLGMLPGGAPGPAVTVAVPTAYMNESGGPVKALALFYSVAPQQLVVIHDDIDLPFGAIRLKFGGGEGGHNGLRSLSSAFGTRDYLRVRVGVGRPPGRMDPADFVLRDFTAAERPEVALAVVEAADAVEMLVQQGLVAAQQRFHAP